MNIAEHVKSSANAITTTLMNERYVHYQECLKDVRRIVDSYIGRPEQFTIPEIERRLDALEHLKGKDRCTF